jgi:glycosyl transferase family 25
MKHSVKAYVINLARSTNRRDHMVRELRKTGMDHEFVEGVEGRDLDLSDTSLVNPTWEGRSPFWPGAVGCILSHRKVYEEILESGAEGALVLEDDVILPVDMNALVEAVSAHMAGAEVVLLQYFSSGSGERGVAYRLHRQGSIRLPFSTVLAFPTDIGDVGGAGAYLITREACHRMARAVLPVRAPADDWEFFYNKGALERVRCVAPIPVQINSAFRTTIDHYDAGTLQTRVRETAIKVPLLSQALTIRRRRIMKRKTRVELVDDPLTSSSRQWVVKED